MIKNTITTLGAIALVLTLAGCSTPAAPEVEPTTVPTVVATPTATPTPEATLLPVDDSKTGTEFTADENGVITLPNGEIADCPEGTPSVLVMRSGSYVCVEVIDQETFDAIWGNN